MVKKTIKKEKLKVSFSSMLEEGIDTIKLEVTYNEPLQKLLRKVAVSGEQNVKYFIGKDETGCEKELNIMRTKVKTAVWNGFNNESRGLLFIKELIVEGKYTFEFYDISILEKTMSLFSSGINRAIELIGEYSNVKHTISFMID